MKRSEVIDIIHEIMSNYKPICTSLDEREVSERIIDALLEIGMLPPNIAIVDGKFDQKKFNDIVSKGINCNKWEEE